MLWISLCLCLLCAILFISVLRALSKKQWFKAVRRFSAAALIFAISIAILSLLSNLYTYSVFSFEEKVATLNIKAVSQGSYEVTLLLPNGESHDYRINGDQWMLGAQVLVYNNLGQYLGLHSRYQLSRLEGLYNDNVQEQTAAHTAYTLIQYNPPAWQFWTRINLLPFLVKTVYGSAVYMPLVDGASYSVKLTQTGLMALPENTIAKEATPKF